MALKPNPKVPGLWTDVAAKPGDPGTYGVIIGVSRYDHLADGKGPLARQKFPGLGQLNVSALTAYQFFDWLRGKYRYRNSPLTRCWLLLAPSDGEKALIDKDVVAHAIVPDFASCSRALNDWFTAMKDLSDEHPDAAKASRSVFFFSGHGVEFHIKKQCLLPSDFPIPHDQPAPLERIDKVVGTGNLVDAMNGVRVPHHFFFLDACRNDLDGLKGEMPIEGHPILPIPSVRGSYANSIFRFHATTTGTRAFQGEPPELTLFGQALMEALTAPPELNPDCDDAVCGIPAHKLICFLELKIPELLLHYPGYHQEPFSSVDARNPTTVIAQIAAPPAPAKPARVLDPCQRLDGDSVAFAVESLGPAPQKGFAQARESLRAMSGTLGRVSVLHSKLYDLSNRQAVTDFLVAKGGVYSLAFSPDGTRLAVAAGDGRARVWDATNGRLFGALGERGKPVSSLSFNRTGQVLASAAGAEGRVLLWDTATGRLMKDLGQIGLVVLSVALSPDGDRLVATTDDGRMRLVDLRNGGVRREFAGDGIRFRSVLFSPDGSRLAGIAADGQARLLDAATGNVVNNFRELGDAVLSVAFSPEGRRLAAATADGRNRLVDALVGRVIQEVGARSTNAPLSQIFSPDGRTLATADNEGQVRLVDVETGRPVLDLERFERGVISLAFSNGGRTLSAAGWNMEVGRIWTPEASDVARSDLAKKRASMLIGLERARARRDDATAGLIQERVQDLLRAEREIAQKAARWERQPVEPFLNDEAAQQLSSQIEIATATGDREHPFRTVEVPEWRLLGFDRLPGEGTYRVECGVSGKVRRFWLSLNGVPKPCVFSLLTGTEESTLFLLKLSSEGRDEAGVLQLARVRAELSASNQGVLGEAAVLWRRIDQGDVSEDVSRTGLQLIQAALESRPTSPLAALVSMIVLLRVGRDADTLQWADRFGQELAGWPDGAAVHVELLYRSQGRWDDPPRGVVGMLLAMKERGLPLTGDALGYLSDRIDTTLRFPRLDEADRAGLEQLRQAVRRALVPYRTGGFFCVFSGSLQEVDPLLLLLPAQPEKKP
jgi:WD40 repeat protein